MTKLYRLLFILCLLSPFAVVHGQVMSESSVSLGISQYHHSSNLMGGGMAFFDYDQDGYEDLYLTGGEDKDVLYRNMGGTHFEDVSVATGIKDLLPSPLRSTSVFTGDINNDGYPDIFVGRQKLHNLLFLNNGNGTFTDITESAGLKDFVAFTMGAAMSDYNLDGYLDLYVINYVKTPNADNNGFYHECYANWLFVNNGDNTFTEVGNATGVDDKGCALAVTFTDFNQDHDPDIYVANDFGEWIVPNAMLQNMGNGNFTNVSEVTNLDVAIYGMGIATGDFNKDGLFDYYITNLGRNVLVSNTGGQIFADVTTTAGVENTNAGDQFSTGWGTMFVDYDHDGHDDLFVGNGEIPAADFIATNLEDPNKMYRNNGNGTFTDVTASLKVGDDTRGRGVAMCDFDKDGDMDIAVHVVNNSNEVETIHFLFYVNEASEGRNWMQVKLKGTTANASAFGSIIRLYANGELWLRETGGGGSHASQHSYYNHFGLDNLSNVDSIVVTWPGGASQSIKNIRTNQTIIITEGEEGFVVEECEAGDCGGGSNPVELETPTNLTAAFVARDQGLAINWTDNSSDEIGYQLERSNGNSPNSFGVLGSFAANTTSYDDTDFEAGQSYIYRVKALGEGDFTNSPYSNLDTIEVDTIPGSIDTLYGAFNEVSLENELNWTADTTAIDSFYVERALGSSTDFALVATLEKDVFTWFDPDVTLGETYNYRIRSGNRYWYSEYRDPIAILAQVAGFGNLSPLDGEIKIFPNPIRDGQVHSLIQGKVLSKPIEVVIQDLTGRILSKQMLPSTVLTKQTVNFDISRFGAGHYIVQFRSEFGVHNAKVVYLE
ncbi:MAG: FG-GAP-like repeat-containing protein [Flammeovirgaceae bacterium]